MFKEKFLAKFGDDRTIASLINELSNLKAKKEEKVKYFNSQFNKLLNKIPTLSAPGVDLQIEWYISSVPSNIALLVDRENLATLANNMKANLYVEKHIISLEKKTSQEDKKSKKVNFRDDSKKKAPKYPFDLEVL